MSKELELGVAGKTAVEDYGFMTVQEVAKYLGTSARYVYGHRDSDKTPPNFVIGGKILFKREDVASWIEEVMGARG